jgi:hypothetical protein
LFEVNVTKSKGKLIIKWQISTIEIPLSDITEVAEDNTYGGEVKDALRIGFPYGTADRIVIKTNAETYIVFTNTEAVKKKIFSSVEGIS